MREVIKIAFRKEDLHVVACHNAASAIAQFEQTPPDAVITDVIMPDQDGYEVCQFVKSHPQFSAAPVILMSGVVNRGVAERAMAVKADELMRKPFQPADLIARVKGLLNPKLATEGVNFTGSSERRRYFFGDVEAFVRLADAGIWTGGNGGSAPGARAGPRSACSAGPAC